MVDLSSSEVHMYQMSRLYTGVYKSINGYVYDVISILWLGYLELGQLLNQRVLSITLVKNEVQVKTYTYVHLYACKAQALIFCSLNKFGLCLGF